MVIAWIPTANEAGATVRTRIGTVNPRFMEPGPETRGTEYVTTECFLRYEGLWVECICAD
jgi:hypothetical protein